MFLRHTGLGDNPTNLAPRALPAINSNYALRFLTRILDKAATRRYYSGLFMSTTATGHHSSTSVSCDSALVADYEAHTSSAGSPRVVLIDLFDTIIGRRVEPEYVKAIWSKRLRYLAGLSLSAKDIHELRVTVEAELCQANCQLGFDDEFRHLDMCNEIFARLAAHENLGARMSAAHFSEICENLELQIEQEVQFIYPSAKALLEKLNEDKTPVYVVSDSFFSTRQMRRILKGHGLDSLIRGFFLSSETLVAKRSGRLFKRVLGTLGVRGHDALMVGDNPISDIANSHKHGIRSILVRHDLESESRLGPKTSQIRLETGLNSLTQSSAKIFPEMALSMYAFTARLFQRAVQLGESDLLFCSREGLLLKELFDRYQEKLGCSGKIRTHYFYTSRLASFLPSLGPLKTEGFNRLFRQYRSLSLRTFLLSLQFPEDLIAQISSALGVPAKEEFSDFPNSLAYAQLRALPLFTDEYERARQEQRTNTIEYLKCFYPNSKLPGTLTLVDVGWKGTIQDNVRNILPDDVTLRGLYVGLVAPGSIGLANLKEGLLFSVLPTKSDYFDAFFESCALFEILLSAQHPGTLRYERQDTRVVPVLGADEKSSPVRELIESLQAAYRHSAQALFDAWSLNHLDELADLKGVAARHGRMVFYPSREELGMIASLDHYENFGVFNHTTFWLPETISRRERLRNLSIFLRNPGAVLASSLWPALSLARHGLEWVQPWYGKRKMKRIFGYASR